MDHCVCYFAPHGPRWQQFQGEVEATRRILSDIFGPYTDVVWQALQFYNLETIQLVVETMMNGRINVLWLHDELIPVAYPEILSLGLPVIRALRDESGQITGFDRLSETGEEGRGS